MNRTEIFEKLDEWKDNPKSKKFFEHLVRAYLPVNKAQNVWAEPTTPFKCVITNVPLISVEGSIAILQDETMRTKFVEHLTSFVNQDGKVENPIKEALNGRVLGFTGAETRTFISQEGYQALLDWFVTRMLQGDKQVNWLAGKLVKSNFLKVGEKLAQTKEEKEALDGLKNTRKFKRATHSLGDNDILRALRDSMDS